MNEPELHYEALDNQNRAAHLITLLQLEKADLRSTIDYNEATGGDNWNIDDSLELEKHILIIQHLIHHLLIYTQGGE